MSATVMAECLEEAARALWYGLADVEHCAYDAQWLDANKSAIATLAVALYQERCAKERDHERDYQLGRNVTEWARKAPRPVSFTSTDPQAPKTAW